MNVKKYPIAEIFTSPQGEGQWSGTLMTFIRIGGCCVGKPFSPSERASEGYASYTEKCTTYDGRNFACDTNYRTAGVMPVSDIVAQIPRDVHDVCLTGGEPLMHDLTELIVAIQSNGIHVHIETSGTVLPKFPTEGCWITVSPKFGIYLSMLQLADEIKLLVDSNFNTTLLPFLNDFDWFTTKKVFIQPINFEHTVNEENMKRCLKIQLVHTNWRISQQMHKHWKVR